MKTIAVAFSLIVSLAASAVAASDAFKADKSSPLKLVRSAIGEGNTVRFAGTVRISGRFLAAWEASARTGYLRVIFLPGDDSAALLPHAVGAGAVKELMVTNNEEAVAMLLDAKTAARLRAKEVVSAEGVATVTIGDYQTVVECDKRWYMARMVAVATRGDVVATAGNVRPAAC